MTGVNIFSCHRDAYTQPRISTPLKNSTFLYILAWSLWNVLRLTQDGTIIIIIIIKSSCIYNGLKCLELKFTMFLKSDGVALNLYTFDFVVTESA